MCKCFLEEKLANAHVHRTNDDRGFMGRTHATSAVALFLLSVAFLPLLTRDILGGDNIWLIIASGVTVAGASLLPDIDNTSSTARNSLGPVGAVLSNILRGFSVFIQTTIRTRRDASEPNAHRGALHTVPAAALFGLGAFAFSGLHYKITLPLLGPIQIAPLIVVAVLTLLMLSGLFKPFMNKLKKAVPVVGELIGIFLSFGIAAIIVSQIPIGLANNWLGFSVFVGYVIHLLGDAFTTAGVPILFPIPRKGKLWWMVRFTSMKAGGVLENVVFVPFFSVLIIIASFRIIGLL